MSLIEKSVTVTWDGAELTAPDLYVADVGSGDDVRVTWYPDNVTLAFITGLPPIVRVTGPTPEGTLVGRYRSPSSPVTWDYTIHGSADGALVKHDPKIHNTTPT